MLFITLLSTLLLVNGGDRRRLTTGWDTADSADHNIDYVKAYIKCQKGMINMWYGDTHKLPFGWKLCDGTEDRPNLMGRFPVGAGGKYEYGDMGGNEWGKITLKTKQLPWHKHSIWADDMTMSKNGKHDHTSSGVIADGGRHWHQAGKWLTTNEIPDHEHWFEGWTIKDGAHIHSKTELWTNEEKEHTHDIDFKSGPGSEHNHNHDLWVTDTNSNHSHDITVDIDEIGNHTHWLNPDHSNVWVNIPPHWHSSGSYKIDDHEYTHNHKVTGWTQDDGKHNHSINFDVDGGNHSHKTELETDESMAHKHGPGKLQVSWVKPHSHWVPEVWTEEKENMNGEHEHEIDTYEHSSWLTSSRYTGNTATDKNKYKDDFGLAVDCVNKDKDPWKIQIDEGEHEHKVPRRETEEDGGHNHSLSGWTGANGVHKHNISGETWFTESHIHTILGDTENDGQHRHSIWGNTDNDSVNLTHTFSGWSSRNGSFSGNFKLYGWTKPSGAHKPTATATTTGKNGKHKHGLKGGIQNESEHTHQILGQTKPTSHKHSVWGTVGNDIDDGMHTHWIKGKTKKWGKHSHTMTGTVDWAKAHSHTINITIDEDGDHNHTVSGMTRFTGEGKEIDINPPYVAVWFICCTLEKSPSFSWSQSAEAWDVEPETTGSWDIEPPKTSEQSASEWSSDTSTTKTNGYY